ncbi:hypothetical protein DPMN_007515 [Dreissena polymorpha]|uniref:Uncharacterized protein n=1 Tax=Dreissena polymorpha TaxID=45954 RepID=A0A9D4MX53_DREPO|nr:hypothetical protein DPMN_007515 [Dreissena polymorpha]
MQDCSPEHSRGTRRSMSRLSEEKLHGQCKKMYFQQHTTDLTGGGFLYHRSSFPPNGQIIQGNDDDDDDNDDYHCPGSSIFNIPPNWLSYLWKKTYSKEK